MRFSAGRLIGARDRPPFASGTTIPSFCNLEDSEEAAAEVESVPGIQAHATTLPSRPASPQRGRKDSSRTTSGGDGIVLQVQT